MSDRADRIAKLSPEKRALLARRLSESARGGTTAAAEPIAVVGLACRFPGSADSPEAFWRLLRDGVDAITEVPAGRWDVAALFDPDPAAAGKIATKWGGFLPDIDTFDPYFFGISPREAARMDPQQRLWLEVAWDAFEDAGLTASALAGSRTGVFLGLHSHSSDYFWLQLDDPSQMDAFTGPGNAHNIAAGRLAYLLDLRGPAVTVDTACSSSLVAVHMACQSLRAGDCGTAVAGGVNAMLSPVWSIPLSRMQMLSPTGRCRAFDASADGFVRGEGAGAVVLRRLGDAIADGDRILAVIRGSAINQDGRTNGITAPNGLSQRALVRDALKHAGVRPERISLVETHGTGTALGDPIELEALAEVLGEGRDGNRPCWIGAVKSNFGHLEGAAGVAGLIKAVLSLAHREIPPVVHFTQLNPHIAVDARRFRVPTSPEPWTADDGPRLAGVSSFGWSGTNVHVIVEEAPAPEAPDIAEDGRGMFALPVSARSAEALAAMASRYRDRLRDADDAANVCFTAAVRRTRHEHRLVVVGETAPELAAALDAFVQGQTRWSTSVDVVRPGRARSVAFVYSGQGSQWAGMGRELLAREPVFRDAIARCDAAIAPLAGWSVAALLASDEAGPRLEQTEIAQPAVFALQVALTELWRSWGVEPDAAVGHSLGEIAAAWCAGALSLEDAARVAVHRGRLMQRVTGQGRMVAVDRSEAEVRAAIRDWTGLNVAALNAPRSTVLSGDTDRVQAAAAALAAQGAVTRYLPVQYAFHSHHLDAVLPELAAALGDLAPAAPRITVVSSVTGDPAPSGAFDAAYWQRNVRQTVRFAPAIERLTAARHDVFLEIGPHPVLRQPMAETASHAGADVRIAHSLHRGRDARATVLGALGALHACGVDVDWRKVYPRGRAVRLPQYAWQRERYWLEHIVPYSPDRRQPRQAGAPPAETSAASNWLYRTGWREWPAAPDAPDRLAAGGRWLILADRGGAAARFARELESAGQSCRLVFSRPGGGEVVDAEDRAAFARLVHEMAGGTTPWRGTIDFWPLEADELEPRDGDGARAASMLEAQRTACGAAAHLLHALSAVRASEEAPLWIVTRGAQAAGETAVSVAQAPIWGLARTIRIEHPSLPCTCVDLDPAAADFEGALALELRRGGDEREVAYRAGRRLVRRLERLEGAHGTVRLRAEATYLITGGLGALGLETARWLVDRGARRIALVGRSAPRESARRTIAALEADGATVVVRSTDMAQAADVLRLIETIAGAEHPLKGVIHAAGVIDDGVVTEQEWPRFARVLAPKLAGAWHLHEATRALDLDFFVLYSSLASLLGSAGQGNYAAANAFLDALAHHRRAQGLPALSVNWGAWSGGGMAAELADANRRRLAASGIGEMAPAAALDGLARALASGEAQAGVLDVDWTTYVAQHGGAAPLLSELPRAGTPLAAAPARPQAPSLNDKIAAAPPERRRRVIVDHVRAEALAVLGVPAHHPLDHHQGLRDVGLDSLTALELKNRLQASVGQALPATLAFDYPTVAAIAGYLAADVLALAEHPAEDDTARPETAPAASLEGLSDEEAEALLAEELAAFKRERPAGASGVSRG